MLSIIISLFPEHLPSHTLCFPVEQGRCLRGLSVPEPDEMMTVAAQLQPGGSGRAFPQAGVRNSFCPS